MSSLFLALTAFYLNRNVNENSLDTTYKRIDMRDVTITATCVTGQHVLLWGRDMSRS
jgi:hypothetical protein